MNIDIVTKQDLVDFKDSMIQEIVKLIESKSERKEWLRSSDVRQMLSISNGTLQNLRITGKLPYKKVNGTLFYSSKDVEGMLD